MKKHNEKVMDLNKILGEESSEKDRVTLYVHKKEYRFVKDWLKKNREGLSLSALFNRWLHEIVVMIKEGIIKSDKKEEKAK